jgi:hypothetical protein
MRTLVVLVALTVATSCDSTGETTAATTTSRPVASTTTTTAAPILPSGVRGTRSLDVRAHLGTGESITFGLHPNAEPFTVHAGTSALELCPGAPDGAPDSFGDWPSSAGFSACIPFGAAGTATAPGVGSDFWHLSVFVRATSPVELDQLTLAYTAVDGYFAVLPATTATLTVVPETATVVAVDGPSLQVRQQGRELSLVDVPSGMIHGRAFGPVEPRVPVEISVTGSAFIDWS